MAYNSNESGREELDIVPFPGPGGKWQISAGGAREGSDWSRDGKELFYLSPENDQMSVELTSGRAGLEVGSPKVLFRVPNWWTATTIAPDGQRFLAAVRPEAGEKARIALVANWIAGLAEK